MEVARLVLDYVQALIWPALIVFVGFRFRGPVRQFLERVVGESEEFSATLPFGVAFATRFRERLATLAEQADSPQLRESVKNLERDLDRDQFDVLTSDFLKLPLRNRRKAAQQIANITEKMELDHLLEYARSPRGGKRLGAAIGLRVHLQRSDTTQQDPRLPDAIRELLGDRYSLVRFRAAEALGAAPQLASKLADELSRLAEDDENSDVRTMAGRALDRAE